jgi:hypothetical protein
MRSRGAAWAWASIAMVALGLWSQDANADSLTADENARLLNGETVTRDETILRDQARYVGGVTYTIIDATPSDLDQRVKYTPAYRAVLPFSKRARLVGENDGDAFIELKQGNALLETTYTIRVHHDEAGNGARFWLDRSKPHSIEDAWGFFRYEPLANGRTLLTYGVLVDVGPGLVRDFFEERIRRAMLRVPQLVRNYLAHEATKYASAR